MQIFIEIVFTAFINRFTYVYQNIARRFLIKLYFLFLERRPSCIKYHTQLV